MNTNFPPKPWLSLLSSWICEFALCAPLLPAYWYIFVFSNLAIAGMMFACGMLTTYFRSPHVFDKERKVNSNANQTVTKCVLCDVPRVSGSRTHHCFQCNACVEQFDHHCPWINNCVSGDLKTCEGNFHTFLGLVVGAIIMFAIQIAFAVFTIINLNLKDSNVGMLVGIVITSVLPFVAMNGMISVLAYLVYIRGFLGMTTYEYLIWKQDIADEKQQRKELAEFEKKKHKLDAEKEALRQEWLETRRKEELEWARKYGASEEAPQTAQSPLSVEKESNDTNRLNVV